MLEILKQEIKRDEGRVTENGLHVVYEDHLGYKTIGYGRLIDARKRGGLTDLEVDMLIEHDIKRVLESLGHALPWYSELDFVRQRALANMCFNLGLRGLLKFKNMLYALQNRDYEKASEEALDSKWALQVGARADRIALQLLKGK